MSEELLAEALYPYDGLVIATKGGMTRSGPNQWAPSGSPEHLREALEGSLRRLKVDQIELYQFHRPDPAIAFEESVGALIELQQQGKIKHIGLSNVTLDQLKQAMAMTEIVSVQNNYSLLNRTSEDVLRFCEEKGIVFIPYFPIGGNVGGIDQGMVERIAEKHHATARQIGLAWLLQYSPVILPIPGTSNIEHLEENMRAVEIVLDTEDVSALDSIAG